MNTNAEYQLIPIDSIQEPRLQARFRPEDPEIADLAASIRAVGLLQPIVVQASDTGYRLVAGSRRLRACKLLGWTDINAHVIDLDSGHETSATLIENLQRTALSPLEEATCITEILEQYGLTQSELGNALGHDRTWISHRLALLSLPEDLMDALQDNAISPSVALELARVTDDESRRYYLDMAIQNGASLHIVRTWVQQWLTYQDQSAPVTHAPGEPAAPVIMPPLAAPRCHICGGQPPQAPLKMVYLCWACAQACAQGLPEEER